MNQAIFLMGVTSFIAMPASVIWGIIDEKIGTRMTTIAMFIYFIVSVCIALVPNIITMYIALVMFASIIGGANNLAISMTASVWGRYDFDSAWDSRIYFKYDCKILWIYAGWKSRKCNRKFQGDIYWIDHLFRSWCCIICALF